MKTLNKLTYVDKSNIHGHGLFARISINEGELIGIIKGVPCSKDGSYVLWLSESEGYEVTCDLKYINHDDNPNACYYDDLSVMALRRIDSGEEITHNYESTDW